MTASILALLTLFALPDEGRIQGRILEAAESKPLAGAFVRMEGADFDRGLVTGRDGAFVFSSVPSGEYVLRVTHPGYASEEFRVALHGQGDVTLIVPMAVLPVPLTPIIVATERDRLAAAESGPVSRSSIPHLPTALSMRAPLVSNALTTPLVADALREPSWDPSGGRRAHVLYLWGTSSDRGRTFVDGATLNAPMHLGGMLPPVDVELLAQAELRTGGISPRFDGGTTYIMDFVTRPAIAEDARFRGEFDPLTSRIGIESGLGGGGSVILSARRVNTEAVNLILGRGFGYGYGDILGRADGRLGSGSTVSATVVGTRESIVLPRDQAEDEAAWRNLAGSLTWRDADTVRRLLTLSFSRGEADLPLLSATGGHTASEVDRVAATAERRWSADRVGGSVGFDVEQMRFARQSSALTEQSEGGGLTEASCTSELPCMRVVSRSAAAFGELSWQSAPTLSGRAGLRLAYRPGNGGVDVLPRVAVTRLIGEATSLTATAGRFSQSYVSFDTPSGPVPSGASGVAGPSAEVVYATHVELNVRHYMGASALSATAFVRRHEGNADHSGRTSPGFEASWSFEGERLLASAAYSFSRSGRWGEAGPTGEGGSTGAGNSPRTEPDRHVATAGIGARVGPVELSVSGMYGRGLPVTAIALEHPSSPTGLQGYGDRTRFESLSGLGGDPSTRPYLRLDAAASAQWSLRWGGRTLTLAPYAKLLNALSHRDALFYLHDTGGDGAAQPLATLPTIPVLGVRWDF